MQHLIGKTVAEVRELRKAGVDTYGDIRTWGITEIVFEDGSEVTIGGGNEEEVYDVFDWSDPDWPVHVDTGWPLTPNDKDEMARYGLVGVQVARYYSLIEHCSHEEALKDARSWPEKYDDD